MWQIRLGNMVFNENIIVGSNIGDTMIENQLYMQAVRQNSDNFLRKNGVKPRYLIKTYGCQMNEHDSEVLSTMLIQMGYEEALNVEEANFILFNTCCVRENAELKVYGNLGALKPIKNKNKDLIIAVSGCMMQQEHIVNEIKTKYRHVDLVFGTHNLHTFPKLLRQVLNSDDMLVDVWDSEKEIIEGLPVIRKKDTKAFVNIMFGCNNFCTYCIVPYTRGRERSRKPHDIINEVKELIADGVKEITLLGQNVNSYGLDFKEDYSFADLLEDVNAIEGQFRIRFMTPHPKDMSDKVIEVIAKSDKICEYIHLPVQSGSNTVLKAMNRGYTREDYLALVGRIRAQIPDVTLSTDIIIGFPGETEQDVDDLIDLIKQVRYDSGFTFIYSIREGTPAAKMTNQVDEKIKHQRFERMLEAFNDIVIEKNKAQVGRVVEVLVEGTSRTGEQLMGRTRDNRIVNFVGDNHLISEFINIKITEAKNFSLIGEMI